MEPRDNRKCLLINSIVWIGKMACSFSEPVVDEPFLCIAYLSFNLSSVRQLFEINMIGRMRTD